MKFFRLLYVLIFMMIDFIYVYLSKDVYESAINSKKKVDTRRAGISALIAYAFMATGWYFLVATKIEELVKSAKYPFFIGAWCGFLYAALVYGVYNFTQSAFVYEWHGYIFYRDLLWGFTSSMVISGVYALLIKK